MNWLPYVVYLDSNIIKQLKNYKYDTFYKFYKSILFASYRVYKCESISPGPALEAPNVSPPVGATRKKAQNKK